MDSPRLSAHGPEIAGPEIARYGRVQDRRLPIRSLIGCPSRTRRSPCRTSTTSSVLFSSLSTGRHCCASGYCSFAKRQSGVLVILVSREPTPGICYWGGSANRLLRINSV